jgi:hypothetical protein
VLTAASVGWMEGLAAVMRPKVWLVISTFKMSCCPGQSSERNASELVPIIAFDGPGGALAGESWRVDRT